MHRVWLGEDAGTHPDWMSGILLKVGDVTILVNNAAVVHGKSLMNSDDDALLKTQHINALGQFWVSKSLVLWLIFFPLRNTRVPSRGNLPLNSTIAHGFLCGFQNILTYINTCKSFGMLFVLEYSLIINRCYCQERKKSALNTAFLIKQ